MSHVVRVRTGVRYEFVPKAGAHCWVAFAEVHDVHGGIQTYDSKAHYATEPEAMAAARKLGHVVRERFPGRVVNRTPQKS